MDVVTNVIVGSSLLAGLAFLVMWAVRPDLRWRVEAPKHRFLETLRRYDPQDADHPDGPT